MSLWRKRWIKCPHTFLLKLLIFQVGRNWGEVTSNEFLFNRSEKEVEALGKVNLDQVKAVLQPLIQEKKLSVQV